MPHVSVDGVKIHYRFDGPEGAPVLVLSNSLGADLTMWDPQVAAFSRDYRLLRYDTRGHGGSDVPPGPYNFERLGRDALGLLAGTGQQRVLFCGLSMGGMTGMWLGVNAPERFERLVLCNTSAQTTTPELWNQRIEAVRKGGMKAIVPALLDRWFTKDFQQRDPQAVERITRVLLTTSPEGYVDNCAAVRDNQQLETLGAIRAPTLVIAGTHDQATPAASGRAVADRIKGARYVELEAAHLSNVEQAERSTAEVLAFLRGCRGTAMDDRERYDNGMKVRRAVLGDAHVDRTLTRRNSFNTIC